MPEPGPYFKPTRFAGEQACGRLVRVECGETEVRLTVESGGRTLSLRAGSLASVRFITYTSSTRGKLECGDRRGPEPVLVTYRPAAGDPARGDGELTAVEFIPEDWFR